VLPDLSCERVCGENDGRGASYDPAAKLSRARQAEARFSYCARPAALLADGLENCRNQPEAARKERS